MKTKMLIGGLIGGIAFFFLGYLFWGLLLSDTMAACTTCQRPMEELKMGFLVIGSLFFGLLLSYIFSQWASISTFMGGATGGATIGLLLSIASNSMMYATSTVYTSMTCILYDIIVMVVVYAIMGGLVGWWLGRK